MTGFIDARQDGIPEVITGSVCIVGAGAAGITLARTLAKTVSDVILIESGGLEIDGKTQSLFAGRQLGIPYYDLTSCRLRYFGGTSNHWSGFCRGNDLIDYEGRPELGLPRWPITRDELQPYVEQAAESLGVDTAGFDSKVAVVQHGQNPAELVDNYSSILETKVTQFAKHKRLGIVFRETIATSPNIKAFLYLNLTHIQLDPEGKQVTQLECATLTGKRYTVQARQYIVCCHGIETARQLLASNDVMADGIGNASGYVGRRFMDHTHIFASKFIPSAKFPKIYDRDFAARYDMNINISFRDDVLRKEKLLQYYCRFNPIYIDDEEGKALTNVKKNFLKPGDIDFIEDVATLVGNVEWVYKNRLRYTDPKYVMPRYFLLEHRLEQAPNWDSRVVLSNRRDAVGNLIADLDWQVNEHDVDSFKRCQALLGQELSALGYGRIEEEEIDRALVEERVAGHYHQIGTVPMSETPETGVVDKNCKVHGIANLHVGGSAVFPTAGYSGPTMMLIGLAMRQAEYISAQLGA